MVCRSTFFRFLQSHPNRSQIMSHRFRHAPGASRRIFNLRMTFSMAFIEFLIDSKPFTKWAFHEENLEFAWKKLIFQQSWEFFPMSVCNLGTSPFSFEYFGTLSKTQRDRFLILSLVLKKFYFFDFHISK